MPHCDLKLYESVIRANWTLEGLCNIVFIANRFSDYVDKCVYALYCSGRRLTCAHSNVGSKLEKECPFLLRLGTCIGNPDAYSLIPRR